MRSAKFASRMLHSPGPNGPARPLAARRDGLARFTPCSELALRSNNYTSGSSPHPWEGLPLERVMIYQER